MTKRLYSSHQRAIYTKLNACRTWDLLTTIGTDDLATWRTMTEHCTTCRELSISFQPTILTGQDVYKILLRRTMTGIEGRITLKILKRQFNTLSRLSHARRRAMQTEQSVYKALAAS